MRVTLSLHFAVRLSSIFLLIPQILLQINELLRAQVEAPTDLKQIHQLRDTQWHQLTLVDIINDPSNIESLLIS